MHRAHTQGTHTACTGHTYRAKILGLLSKGSMLTELEAFPSLDAEPLKNVENKTFQEVKNDEITPWFEVQAAH